MSATLFHRRRNMWMKNMARTVSPNYWQASVRIFLAVGGNEAISATG
jgi:hypothetical protein